MKEHPSKSGGWSGFSLLEVLACVAIVSALAAFLVAASGLGVMAANRAKCASNLRQIGLAIAQYTADHGGYLPPTTHSSGSQWESAWIYALAPYLDNLHAVRICPADPQRAARLKGGGTSYILNNIVCDPQYGPFGEPLQSFNQVLRLPYPSRVFLAGIIAESRRGAGVQNDHTHAEAWDAGWTAFTADIEANRHRTGASNATRTNGSANYLFVDGHVETISAAEMKARFDRGENLARPPQS